MFLRLDRIHVALLSGLLAVFFAGNLNAQTNAPPPIGEIGLMPASVPIGDSSEVDEAAQEPRAVLRLTVRQPIPKRQPLPRREPVLLPDVRADRVLDEVAVKVDVVKVLGVVPVDVARVLVVVPVEEVKADVVKAASETIKTMPQVVRRSPMRWLLKSHGDPLGQPT